MDNDIGTISYGIYNSILDVSEDNINLINKKVTEILSNQYIRAKEILTKNMEFVNMVAKKLIKDCIISKEELDKMYKEYVTVT